MSNRYNSRVGLHPPFHQGRRCEDMRSRWFGLGVEAEVMEVMEDGDAPTSRVYVSSRLNEEFAHVKAALGGSAIQGGVLAVDRE